MALSPWSMLAVPHARRKTLPAEAVTQIDDAGHFSQEDAHERIVPKLLGFLADEPVDVE